jgi:SAM-dependent methyltransferase
MNSADDSYIYSQAWKSELTRLEGLAAQFDPVTIRQLNAAGVGAGWHCLEVGAGSGSIARWLAAAVGEPGRVMVTDIDTRFLDGLSGGPVEVHRHDISRDDVAEQSFDLVHARAVLEHIPARREIVPKLVGALRPGGTLVVEDVVVGGPSSQAWLSAVSPADARASVGRAMEAVAAGFRAVGADPQFGLELPALLVDSGLDQVTADISFSLVRGGSKAALFYSLTIEELGDRLIAAGLLSQQDVDTVVGFARQPESRRFSIGLVSATGRRPA